MSRVAARVWTAGFGLVAFASVAIALASTRYLTGVGPLAPNVLANAFAAPWLAIHVAGAAAALLVGSMQFVAVVRRRWPAAHRWTGRTYVLGCTVGGASGLMLALGSSSGAVASAGFGLLAAGWIITTALGWRYAVARNFALHRRWMIRSWSLTLAAVTLRIYLPISIAAGLPFEQAYVAISFLCWIPNLLMAELHLALPALRRTGKLDALRASPTG